MCVNICDWCNGVIVDFCLVCLMNVCVCWRVVLSLCKIVDLVFRLGWWFLDFGLPEFAVLEFAFNLVLML